MVDQTGLPGETTMTLQCTNCKQSTEQMITLKDRVKRQSLAIDQLLSDRSPSEAMVSPTSQPNKSNPFDVKIESKDLQKSGDE